MPMQGGNGWRAKLYELESTGTWLDQGTGYVNCELDSSLGYPTLVMYGEQGEEVLLQSKIQSDELYEKQGGRASDRYDEYFK